MNIHSPIYAQLDRTITLVESKAGFGSLGEDSLPDRRQFKIETVHNPARHSSANSLLSRRYGWRGYGAVSLPAVGTDSHVTFSATQRGETIGTITVGFDGPGQMSSDVVFGPELKGLRDTGRRLCEFTKLATDPLSCSKQVLAALFHVAYTLAFRLRGVDTLVMEVNPRHVRYYQRMLGAKVIGDERLNVKVNAPAVPLSLELTYARDQIERFGGRPELASTARSLYPAFFTLEEEADILSRLTSVDRPTYRQHRSSSTYHSAGLGPRPGLVASVFGCDPSTGLRENVLHEAHRHGIADAGRVGQCGFATPSNEHHV